jgi:hypothetical protein
MRDLESPFWIKLKGILFLLIGCSAAVLLLASRASLRDALLLVLCIWAFCRAYYFAFYVIEHYVDPTFKFSGIGSAILHLVRAKQTKQRASSPTPATTAPPVSSTIDAFPRPIHAWLPTVPPMN